MNTLILVAHIFFAVLSLSFATSAMIATYQRNLGVVKTRLRVMWASTGTTIISGSAMVLIMGAPLGRFCISSLTLLAVIAGAQTYHEYVSRRQKISL